MGGGGSRDSRGGGTVAPARKIKLTTIINKKHPSGLFP